MAKSRQKHHFVELAFCYFFFIGAGHYGDDEKKPHLYHFAQDRFSIAIPSRFPTYNIADTHGAQNVRFLFFLLYFKHYSQRFGVNSLTTKSCSFGNIFIGLSYALLYCYGSICILFYYISIADHVYQPDAVHRYNLYSYRIIRRRFVDERSTGYV